MLEFVLGQFEEDIRLPDDDGNIYVVPNDISSITTYVLLEQQRWLEKELSFVKRYLAPGMVVIDVGANLGMYTIPMAQAVGPTGHVFAFEPGSKARGRLEQSVACNDLQNISVSPHGVGAHEARAILNINDSSELNKVSFDTNVYADSEPIEITTLDIEFPIGRGMQIDFLKIDAEGMEADVIRGGYNLLGQTSPVVMAEIKDGYTHNTNLLGLFHELGYRTYRLLGDSSMLVPLEDAAKIDGFELNCFAVKKSTANLMNERGLLANSIVDCILNDKEQKAAIDAYCALPFAVDLGISASDVLLCPFTESLIAYAAYRFVDHLSPDRKLALLSTAENLLRAYCQRTECMAASTTLARVSNDMGYRVASKETLMGILKRGKCELVQPFFPASCRFELLPADDVPAWFVAGLEDALDRQGSFSSMFSTDIDRLVRLVTGRFGSSKHFRSLSLKATQQIPAPNRRAECFHRVIELEPYSAEAFANIGAALRWGQRSDSAITILKHALEIDDRCIEAYRHLANAYLDEGDADTAVELFRRALDIAPDNAKVHSNLGTALCALGRLEDAHSSYKRAVSLAPEFAEAHANMSAVLLSLERTEEAVLYGYRAIELDPSNADAANNLGASLADQGNEIEAIEHYRGAITIKPSFASAHLNLGSALKNCWRVQEALDSFGKVIELDSNAMDARTSRLFLLSYLPDQSYEQTFQEACHYGVLAASNARPYTHWTNLRDPEKYLRIGMVSGDFKIHSVGYFIEGVISALSANHSSRLEIYAYMTCDSSDATTEAIRSTCRQWREVWNLSDEALAKQIHDDQVDILIDLSGHTAYNRLTMFAWKPAPIQVTWLGYWATTGIKEIDYLLADPRTLTPDEEQWFTEKIWRLPETRLCFTPWDDDLPVSSLPAIENGYITFGAFHNLNKINEAVIDIWAQVVNAVPGSRIFLKTNQLSSEHFRNRVSERFLAHGIEPNRLLLEGASPRDEYLSTYGRIDIQLDTFPFPGGTVTAESLWMGVPVLTMSGQNFLERQGAGLLISAGLPDWVAEGAESYVALAVEHTENLDALAQLRGNLRKQLRNSPLFNPDKFALDLSEAFRGMWKEWCGQSMVAAGIGVWEHTISDQATMLAQRGASELAAGKIAEAEASYRKAIDLAPRFAKAHCDLGIVLACREDRQGALASLRHALSIDSNLVAAHVNLGLVLEWMNHLGEATASYKAALRVDPDCSDALLRLATIHEQEGSLDEAIACYRQILTLCPEDLVAFSALLSLYNYRPDLSSEEICAEARLWGSFAEQRARPWHEWGNIPNPDRRLRVGFVSADFSEHPVGYFFEGVLSALASAHSDRVEVYCYMNGDRADALTDRIRRNCHVWRYVRTLSDEELAVQIRDDRVDILVDLSGHTASNRLPVFAWKPAPVQVSWLGYFATTGLDSIDFLLADHVSLLPEEEIWFSEKIWRLPQTRLCFSPPHIDVAVSPLPALLNGYVTFGCFNNLLKINDAVILLWARVLQAIPSSRLYIKSRGLDVAAVRERILNQMLANGIDHGRLILEGGSSRHDYLAAYRKVDISLDPFPFPGGATTAESLWMGVPVLTLPGRRFLSRQGASLLSAAYLTDWIAEDERDYVVRAISYSSNLPALADLRKHLRSGVMASPLYDASRIADYFEVALRGMWRVWCEEHPMSVTNEPVDDAQSDRLINMFYDGNHFEVEREASDLVSQYPQSPFAWGIWGAALQVQGKDGLAMLMKAAELQPDDAQAQNNLGVALLEKKRTAEALTCFELAVRIDPVFAEGFYNLGSALQQLDKKDEAVAAYDKAIALSPSLAKAHNNLACIFQDSGRFEEAVASYRRAIQADSRNTTAYLKLGLAQLENWQLEDAVRTCQDAFRIDPGDARLFSAVIAMEHNLPVTKTAQQFIKAKRFGELVAGRATAFSHHRDATQSERSLRVGFVSGDLRGHPVGYFMEGLMGALTACVEDRLSFWAYFPSEYPDATTERIKPHFAVWRSVAGVTDEALARQIKEDGIDILVDLAGHTAGNRLPVFAWKPAPVQISWLGYLNTTGLEAIDYLIADEWVLPEAQEKYFTEAIWRLESSYLCFAPPSVPVEVNSLRAISNGYVTFGCFNNLAKISNEVVSLWARILQAVPHSRLYLKAKQFKYPSLRRRVIDSFACHGIDASRLILEGTVPGRSEHFEDYHRVDIALDPFPYPGITTSLEALWMGVPVLTMTGQSLLSRQGVGLLMNAGLPEWIASDADDYVARAVKQADDIEGLARLRRGLREQVLASPLYDQPRFASRFEAALRGMWRDWCTPKTGDEAVQSRRKVRKVFLHVGCGSRPKSHTTRGFSSDEWDELRFDIDETVKPDIVGTMLDMSAVADGSVDAVFSAHNIEHLYPHEVPLALAEFRRVLKPDGFVVITCPDLRSICQLVADDKLVEPAYDSPAGPIAPLDVLYGLRTSMSQGNLYMAHRCGFTERVLVASLQESGFFSIVSGSRGHPCYDLWALASKNDRSEDDVSVLADAHFPA